MIPRATIDVETRSTCAIRTSGSWRYALDPTTTLLCCAFRLPSWAPGRTGLYHPAFPQIGLAENALGTPLDDLVDLFDWIESGGLVEAHNAWFERGIWTHICEPRLGWPAIPHTSWRCSAAKAAAHALPRSLGDATAALDLPIRKDEAGAALMQKLVKPRKPVKAERDAWGQQHAPCPHCHATGRYDGINPATGRKKKLPCEGCHGRGWRGRADDLPPMPTLWHESPDQFARLFDYCRTDVLAEDGLSHALPDLSDDETAIYLLDQAINVRGFALDPAAITTAQRLIDEEFTDLNAELAVLTGGVVTKASQRAKMVAWFADHGLDLDDTTADTIAAALTRTDLSAAVRRGLELMQLLGKSSTAKFDAMAAWICPDHRVHGGLLYHGASTGRWPISGDHECLTPSGWVRMDAWHGGPIMCWREGGHMAFAEAARVTAPLAPGEQLVRWQNQKVDQVSTWDHSMPVFQRVRRSPVSDRVWGGGFVKKPVLDLAPGDRVPLTGVLDADAAAAPQLSDLQVRILVMAQADGHYVTDPSAGQCLRFGFRKERKIQRCMELLDAAGIPCTLHADGTALRFRVPRQTMPSWLWAFHQKTFEWAWLSQINPDVFFSELAIWDGHASSPHGIEYTSINKQNVDFVQALAHISGRTCGMRVRVRAGWSDAWWCCIDTAPQPVTFRKPQRSLVVPTSSQVYCAQTPTGYFLVRRNGRAWITGNTGAGIQPQNFPRGTVHEDPAFLWDCLSTLPRADISEALDGASVLAALSSALRGVIVAGPGQQIYCADYAAIEGRVLLWLAGDEDGLDIFRQHRDIYNEMASAIYGYPVFRKSPEHKTQGALGKVAVLGLGYQMGAAKFVETAKVMGGVDIVEDLMCEHVDRQGRVCGVPSKLHRREAHAFVHAAPETMTAVKVVAAYRAKFWRVKQLWDDCESAAIRAVLQPGRSVRAGRVSYRYDAAARFLYATLPSGRRLAYPDPDVTDREMPWGAIKPSLSYMGVNAFTRKWSRQTSYGGLLVENCTQAVARDLMAAAMLRCEQSGVYRPVLSVHDELIAEADLGAGSVAEFEALMAACPRWAADCPVEAEGWCGPRYRK